MKKSIDKIFDLEQSIMQCWNVTDDIKLITSQFLDRSPPLTEDEMANILIGIETMYQLKFEKLWSEFEDICKDYHKFRKIAESVQDDMK